MTSSRSYGDTEFGLTIGYISSTMNALTISSNRRHGAGEYARVERRIEEDIDASVHTCLMRGLLSSEERLDIWSVQIVDNDHFYD